MKPDWKWLAWQVGLPLGGPVVLSAIFVAFWWTLANSFVPRIDVVLDITPWAITFYGLTLIATALRELWPLYSRHPGLFIWLVLLAIAIVIYYAFMVIVRHESTFVPKTSVYIVTIALVAAATYFCHEANRHVVEAAADA